MRFDRITPWLIALLLLGALSFLVNPRRASAQGPTPTPPPAESARATDTLAALARLALDTLQGQSTANADQLFERSKQSVSDLLNDSEIDLFFLDFGNPNLQLNQFAANVARTLLLLTPLYAAGYLVFLIYSVWREHPIPNPILYALLVIGVMVFLAAFAVITQSVSELGRAIALAFGGASAALYPRAALETGLRTLVALQKNGGILATPVLLIAAIETFIILIQLAYRGISFAIWRLLTVLVIPFSVLLEGMNPKTAGQVLSGFFESWLDLVGKTALLLLVLAIASGSEFSKVIWFILPAGLLIVIFSWRFFGVIFVLVRNTIARLWSSLAPAAATETALSMPAAAEAARAKEIDAARRRTLEE